MAVALSDTELYARAKDLAKDFDDNFLELGKTLAQLTSDSFRKMYQSTNLGRRKAYYLVEIWDKFHGLPVPKAKLKEVGWTKLTLLAKHVTKENAAELLDVALGLSNKQLGAYLAGKKVEDNARCVLMYFSPKQYAVLEKTILANGGEKNGRGLTNKEEALIKALRKTAKAAEADATE